MADLLDVETALAHVIYGALYPNGSPPSVLNIPVKIYAGWPDPATLAADLAPPLKALHVSVYAPPGMERNTTRYPSVWIAGAVNPTTWTLTASGRVITIGGQAPANPQAQNLAAFVNGKPYFIQSTGTETATQLASALQAKIVVGVPGTTFSGSTVTVPANARIGAFRVGATAPMSKEVRRSERVLTITAWADNMTNRSNLAKAFDPVLSDTSFFTTLDGSCCRLIYKSSADNDFDQKQGIYRRDLSYSVEFPTVRTGEAAEIVAFEVDETLTDSAGDVLAGPNVSYA